MRARKSLTGRSGRRLGGADDQEVQARIRVASQRAAAGEVFRETLRYWRADGTSASSTLRCIRFGTKRASCAFCTRPGSTSPTGCAPKKRCAHERQRSAKSRSVCSGPCCPGRWSYHAGCRSRLVMRQPARRWRSAGTGTTSFSLADGRVGADSRRRGRPWIGRGRCDGSAAYCAGGAGAIHRFAGRAPDAARRFVATTGATISRPSVTACSSRQQECSSTPRPVTHPSFSCRPEGRPAGLTRRQSPPLCGDDEHQRPQAKVILEPGSLLVLLLGWPRRTTRRALERPPRSAQGRPAAHWSGLAAADICDNSSSRWESRRHARTTSQYSPSSTVRSPEQDSTSSSRPNPANYASCAPRCVNGSTSAISVRQPGTALVLAIGEACSNAIEHAYTRRVQSAR